jgi:prophage antirepressor-like protein
MRGFIFGEVFMNDLKVFEFETKKVRTEIIEGNPWFVAKDVCEILDIKDSSQAVERLDNEEKLIRKLYVSGQDRELWTLNESGQTKGIDGVYRGQAVVEASSLELWRTKIIPAIKKAS